MGAPPEIANMLEEMKQENDLYRRRGGGRTCIGVDPELDEFMVPYLNALFPYDLWIMLGVYVFDFIWEKNA